LWNTNVSSQSTFLYPLRITRIQKSFSSPYPFPKASSLKYPALSTASLLIYIQKPTAVGISGYFLRDTCSIKFANASIVHPAGSSLFSQKLGIEHIVPLLVKGVTVPIVPSVYAHLFNLRLHPSVTIVSLFKRITSFSKNFIPLFTVFPY